MKNKDGLDNYNPGMLQSLLEHIPDVLWTTDHNGNTIYISPNVTDVYGFSPEEIYRKGEELWFGRIHPDDANKVKQAFENLINKNTPFDIDYRIQRKDGIWIWLHDRAIRTYKKDGQKIASGVFYDITEKKISEELFRTQEDRYRAVVETQNEFIVRHKPDGTRTFVNEAYCRYFGQRPEQLLSSSFYPLIPEDQRVSVEEKLRELTPENHTFTEEHEAMRPDGSLAWQEWTSRGIFDADGKLIEVQSIGRDITEKRLIQQELYKSEEQFRHLVEHSVQGIIIHRDFKPLFVNQAILDISGYKDKSDFLMLDSILTFIVEEDRPIMRKKYEARVRGESLPGFIECRGRRKDGKIFWLNLSASVIEWEGEPAIMLTLINITEHKEAEEALRISESRLKEAQRITRIGNWELDLTTNTLYWSDEICNIFGLAPQEFEATYEAFLEHVHPDDRSSVDDAYKKSVKTRTPYNISHKVLLKDGSIKYVNERCETYYDDAGNAIRSIGTVQDVTELKQTEEALYESENKYKTLFEQSADAILILEGENFSDCNMAAIDMFGFKNKEEVLGTHPSEISPEIQSDGRNSFEKANEMISTALDRGSYRFEWVHQRKNGDIFPAEVLLTSVPVGERKFIHAIVRDITDRKKAETALKTNEERLQHLNRIYEMLSGINSAILRVRDKQGLFDETCQIVTEGGVYQAVGIRLVDMENNTVVTVASGGEIPEIVTSTKITLSKNDPFGKGPSGIVLREGRSYVINDISSDPRIDAWRDVERNFHIKACAAFPLIVNNKTIGVLSLYSKKVNAFDEEEIRLLNEIVANASLGLEYIEKEKQLDYLYFHDIVTGLPNRKILEDRLSQALSRFDFHSERLTAILILSVENFRRITDVFGAHTCDIVLREISSYLASALRTGDFVAKISAHDFGILLVDLATERDISIVANKLLTSLPQMVTIDDNKINIIYRSGIAVHPRDSNNENELIRYAGQALSAARIEKSTLNYFSSSMASHSEKVNAIEHELQNAIENNEFRLFYQPIVNVIDRKVVSLEALLRWENPKLGWVSPAEFIPIAEESGLIIPIGNWIIKQAIQQILSWVQEHITLRVAINVSPHQLRQDGFADHLLNIINETGTDFPYQLLSIEITESSLIESVEKILPEFDILKKTGIGISVDDFGTGYSSLSYLRKLPVDVLKIDREFIHGLPELQESVTLVKGIIGMAKGLGLKVIAEGVETEEQYSLLKNLECDFIQGYLISKPIQAVQIIKNLHLNN